jgi:hypothetical protein
MGSDYYDFKVTLMDTAASFREERLEMMDENCVLDADRKCWRADGFSFRLGREEFKKVFLAWQYTGDAVQIAVEDNGEGGDGLWLVFSSGEGEEGSVGLGCLTLTRKQATILGTALQSAAAMRKAQEEE